MRTLSRIYLALNRLFGDPQPVQKATYTRTELLFDKRAVPLLQGIAPRLSKTSHVLVVGCGQGMEAAWLAEHAGSVVAVDVNPRFVEEAARRTAALPNVHTEVVDAQSLPFAAERFDLVFMHNVCEHIMFLHECFSEYYRVLRPGGSLLNSFSPLFYSPFGAHLQDALKLPWGHLIFGPRTTAEVRNVYYPGTMSAESWADFGLNRLTEARYRRTVLAVGFEMERHEVRTSLGLPLVRHIPFLRNLFIVEVMSLLRKPA